MKQESELDQLRKENLQLKSLLGRINSATQVFFKPKEVKSDNCPYEQIMISYHRLLPMLPRVAKLTTKRKAAMRNRWQNDLSTINDWESYFEDASTKPFLRGENGRAWVANIDFLLREDSIAKMQEGKYDS